MHNFKKLKVWQYSVTLTNDIYKITSKFPKSENFGLKSQINRAVISISSNIAEGSGRFGENDFLRFLDIANGSAFELESQLLIASNLGYLNKDILNTTISKVTEIQKMIQGIKAYHKAAMTLS